AVFAILSATSAFADYIFYYTSSPTSDVGRGATRQITQAGGFTFNGHRDLTKSTSSTNDVQIQITSRTEIWQLDFLDFRGPDKTLAIVGNYPTAQRYPFESAGNSDLSFIGNGVGNNVLTGSFQVLEV